MTLIQRYKWRRVLVVSVVFALLLAVGAPLVDSRMALNIVLAGVFIGGVSGFLIMGFELFLVPRWFGRLSAWAAWLANTVITFLLLAGTLIAAVELFGMRADENSQFIDMFGRADFQIGLAVSFALIAVTRLALLVNGLLGRGVLRDILLGRYHRPRETERVFMFLDLKSSTAIAERIGHKRFLELLNEFFLDVSEAILATGGEIYKYVGDEVIVSWPVRRNRRGEPTGRHRPDAVDCHVLAADRLRSRGAWYEANFGVRPEFKAGVHAGVAVCGEAGTLKKEIAWLGDALNTTARLEAACGKLGVSLLVSAQAKDVLNPRHPLLRLGRARLRGKDEAVEVFSLEPASRKG